MPGATSLPGRLTAVPVDTPRLRVNCWVAGPAAGVPLLLVHGNLVSGRWWDQVAAALPADLRVVAPDLRGFGRSEVAPVDATRGLRDFSDDLRALVVALGLADRGAVHLAGWSLGGGVCQRYAIDHPDDLASVALVAPLSPYGLGGTSDVAGTPTWPDHAGSGGGGANPGFVARLAGGDTSGTDPMGPRQVMRAFFAPDDLPAAVEDALLDEVLHTAVGDANYPGDVVGSPNWPGVAPGTGGVLNAMSPRWCDTSAFATAAPRVPVLWLRAAGDRVISDGAALDFGTLGSLGQVPGWPGAEVFPAQPQVAQTAALLARRRAAGAAVTEVELPDAAHGLVVERPAEVARLLDEHVRAGLRRLPEPESGGDPACWLSRVCPECGLFVDGPLPAVCGRCGATVPAE